MSDIIPPKKLYVRISKGDSKICIKPFDGASEYVLSSTTKSNKKDINDMINDVRSIWVQ